MTSMIYSSSMQRGKLYKITKKQERGRPMHYYDLNQRNKFLFGTEMAVAMFVDVARYPSAPHYYKMLFKDQLCFIPRHYEFELVNTRKTL
jgi:hypothetical protein